MPPESIELKTDSSTSRFSAYVLSRFGAPKLGELAECNVPEMEEPPNYLGSFVLNSMFHITWKEPVGRLILMFGRRVEHAIREYRIGRELLGAYVAKLSQTNNHFLHAMRAATHFEQCIASANEAIALRGRIMKLLLPDTPLARDDREERLRLIWNRSKHFDEDLVGTQVASIDITAPVWLTNNGIESTAAVISHTELRAALADLLTDLKFFSEDFPKQVADRRKAEAGGT
jgi:hypothetical protein